MGGTCRTAAVWYVVESKPSKYPELILMRQAHAHHTGPKWIPKFMPRFVAKPRPDPKLRREPLSVSAAGLGVPDGVELLANADTSPEFALFLDQVFAISEKTFKPQDVLIEIPQYYHATLLVDIAHVITLAYCLYTFKAKDDCLYVHQLAVL